jgi:hypothetical protein
MPIMMPNAYKLMSMIRSMIEDSEKKKRTKVYLVSGYTGTIIGIPTSIPALISMARDAY